MTHRIDIEELQIELTKYDGWKCSFGQFTNSHSRLVLYLESSIEKYVKAEIHLFFVEYVKGPTLWPRCKLKVVELEEKPGYYKIFDDSAEFEAIGFDEVNINGELNCLLSTKT